MSPRLLHISPTQRSKQSIKSSWVNTNVMHGTTVPTLLHITTSNAYTSASFVYLSILYRQSSKGIV